MQQVVIKKQIKWTQDLAQKSTIPIAVKRRCSKLSKMALDVANSLLQEHEIDYAVFCSQHGEIETTVKLLREITSQTLLSPMNFSQSVHNTAAGLFSVLNKLTLNITSIAAGENTLAMGMLDAINWLKLNPGKTVLVVAFDVHVPIDYKSLEIKGDHEYALGLLLADDGNGIKPDVEAIQILS